MKTYNFPSIPILNTLRTAIVISNEDGQILWANAASEELFATSNKRLQKYNVHDLFAPANHSEKLSRHTANLIPNLQPVITHDQWIVGTQEPILVDYCISLFDASFDTGDFFDAGVFDFGEAGNLYMIEIWAKNRHHQISQDQNQQAQYDLAKNMLRSVAHEVKNPLAGIRGAGQLLTKHLQRLEALDDKTQVYSDIIISETDRLTALINQLMGVKNLTSNQATNQLNNLASYQSIYQPLNLHKSLEQVLTLIQSESNATNMKLTIVRDYDLSLPEIMGDANQLIQVFLNLAKNANEAMKSRLIQLDIVKTTEDSEKMNEEESDASQDYQLPYQTAYQPTLTVVTRVEFSRTMGKTMHKKVAKISIVDNGNGIADELKEQIFFPLVTGRAEGTGLGLSVVHDIISQHQGQIKVKSNYGNTSFHVYLPFCLSA